jgi:hypothetical protein
MKTFRATIDADHHVLRMYSPDRWREYLETLEGDILITISQPKDIRSKQQNDHYWGILTELVKEEVFSGYSRYELHEVFKEKFDIDSTKDLTVEQFSGYLNDIREFAREYAGVYLREPDDY